MLPISGQIAYPNEPAPEPVPEPVEPPRVLCRRIPMGQRAEPKENVTKPRTRAEHIAAEVGEQMGVTLAEILGRSLKTHIVKARHTAMVRVRNELRYSFPRLAKEFNRANHTTIWHAVHKIERSIKEQGAAVKHGKYWSPEEDAVLRRGYEIGQTLAEIGAELDRSPHACESRASHLGLRRHPDHTRRAWKKSMLRRVSEGSPIERKHKLLPREREPRPVDPDAWAKALKGRTFGPTKTVNHGA